MLFGRRSAKDSHLLLLSLLLILDLTTYQMQDLRLPPQEKGMTENVLARVLAALMEAIHVELPNEGVDISMPEVFW